MLRSVGVLFCLALLASTCLAAPVTVYISFTGSDTTGNGSEGSPYLSLQKAVESSQAAGNFDITVVCAAGDYFFANNSNIVISQGSLTIAPTQGTCNFLLYHVSGDIFFVNAVSGASLTLNNLMIVGGSAASGGLVSVTGGATLSASHVLFGNGTATNQGGLVYLNNAQGSTFSGCQFEHSTVTSTQGAGGLVAAINTDVVFTGCNFTAGTAERGGAVLISNTAGAINYAQSPTFTACTFSQNKAQAAAPNNAASAVGGGAVQIDSLPTDQSVLFTSCVFDDNKAEEAVGGAVSVGQGASATFVRSQLTNNKAHVGGAVFLLSAELVASNSVFIGNTASHSNDASSGQGGAIGAVTSFLTINGATFTANNAAANGGAIAHIGGPEHIANPPGQDNTNITGSTFVSNTALDGGAIYLYALSNPVSLKNNNYVQNRADGVGLETGGGAIYCSQTQILITGLSSFENNTAVGSMGGAIYYAVWANTPIPTAESQFSAIVGAYFQFNSAATGGAMCVDGLGDNQNGIAVQQSRFAQNYAVCTSDPCPTANYQGTGGAVMSFNTTVVFVNTEFYDNKAALLGGALYAGGPVPSFPHTAACFFWGNGLLSTANARNGGTAAYIGGAAQAVFANTNETLGQDGYQLVVGGNATATVLVTADQTAPCSFSGMSLQDNARVYFNCSASIENVDIQDQASIHLVTTTSLSITKNLNWLGGGFVCNDLNTEPNAAHSIIYLRASNKGGATLTNKSPKFLNNCNLGNQGNMLIQNFPGNEATDLELFGRTAPEIYSFGSITTIGDVVIHNAALQPALLQSSGSMKIDLGSTLSLTGTNFNYLGLGGSAKDAPYFTIFLINRNATFSPAQAAAAADIPTYTAFGVSGEFHPSGVMQVILPELWKGTWPNLITYKSRSSKWLIARALVARNETSYSSHPIKVKYHSNAMDASIKKSTSAMTGPQVFGVIFGVMVAVFIIAGLAYWFYRRQAGPAQFDGEVYQPINTPRYGTTD